MNHQYAFAIAFDQRHPEASNPSEPECFDWHQFIQQLSGSLVSEGFPDFNHPRWEEFGDGHIFWGTKTECDSLKMVLSSFPISLYEERNLEAGYYTHDEGTYYVNQQGDIFGIAHQTHSEVKSLRTIPLNAYKTHAIAPELETAFQQAIAVTSHPLLTHLIDKPVDIFEQQLETQPNPLEALESQVNPELDIDFLEDFASTNDDPIAQGAGADLEQQSDALFGQIDALEADDSIEELSEISFDPAESLMADIRSEVGDDLLEEMTPLMEDVSAEASTEMDVMVEEAPVEFEALKADMSLDAEDESLEAIASDGDDSFMMNTALEVADSEEEQLEVPLDQVDEFMADLAAEVEDGSLEEIKSVPDHSLMDSAPEAEEMEEEQLEASLEPVDTLMTDVTPVVEEDSLEELTAVEDDFLMDSASEVADEEEMQLETPFEQVDLSMTDATATVEEDDSLEATAPVVEELPMGSFSEMSLSEAGVSEESVAEDYEALKQLSVEQSETISILEQQTQQLQSELDEAKRSANAKIDPQEHEAIKVELNDLTQEIQGLEQTQQQLTAEVEKWTQIANSKIELEVYDQLSQTHQEQGLQLKSFEEEIEQLKQELSNWQSIAEEKVDRGEYEEALNQIQTMRAKLSRSWLTRLKDWLKGR